MFATLEKPETSPFTADYRLLSAGVFLLIVCIAFEFMAVATALPVAARQLGDMSLYPWAFTGFLGAGMFANGVGGEWCDRVGPRTPLGVGGAAFAAGLVLSGLSQSMPMLICGRVVQGIGAGFVIVAVYVVIGQCYPESHRPRVMSLLSTAWVVPSVIGPFIAGGLTQFVSWRWAFLSLTPLVALPMVLVWRRIAGGTGSDVRRPGRVQLAALMAAGAALLQEAGLEAKQAHWLAAGVATVAGAAMVVLSAHRLFPRGTLRLRHGLPSVIAFRGVIAGGFFGCETYVPLMLVEHRDATPTLAGLAVACTAIGWSTGSWWQGRPTLSRPRWWLVRVGAAVTTVGVLVTATAAVDTSALAVPAWMSGVGLVIGGLGMGLSMSSNAVLLFDLSPEEDRGANSGAIQMSDSLGGVLVIGAGGVFYALERNSLDPTTLFLGLFAISFVVMVAAVAVAVRVRPFAAALQSGAIPVPRSDA